MSSSPKSHYELIRNKFWKLDPKEFDLLVSYLLRTMGFGPTHPKKENRFISKGCGVKMRLLDL